MLKKHSVFFVRHEIIECCWGMIFRPLSLLFNGLSQSPFRFCLSRLQTHARDP